MSPRLRRWLLNALRRSDGATAAEFALILPVLVLIFVAVVDLSGAIWTLLQVGAAARAGGDYALVNSINCPITTSDQTKITTAITNATNLTGLTATTPSTSYGCPDASAGITTVSKGANCTAAGGGAASCYVSVGASGSYTALFAWPGIPRPMTLSSAVRVRVN
jgi:Flp pilus assembly protein TadG